jgi:zinc protease
MHTDTPLLDLAATVLGTGRASRLYRAVREKQLASSVSAYNYTPTDVGVFVVHAETRPQRAGEALRAAWAEVAGIREHGIAEGEMARARRIFESRWLRRLESMEGQASYLAEWEALGSWQLGGEYLATLLAATPKAVADATRRWLDPSQASVVAYRPAGGAPLAFDAAALERELTSVIAAAAPAANEALRAPATPAGTMTRERSIAGVDVFRTRSGIPILVKHKPGAPIVHFGIFAAGGASEEPIERAGLTMLMTRSALKGTERRTAPRIAADAELLGGSISPGTGGESFGWSFSVPTAHLEEAVELLADVVQNPVFPEDGFEAERQVALADVAMLRDDMYRYPMRMATEAAYGSHPYGVPVMGTEESLRVIEPQHARDWHRERALASASVIALVGDVDTAAAAGLLARYFDALRLREAPRVATPHWPRATAVNMLSREKNQTAIAIAFQAPARNDEERFAAQLAAGVASGLGGRFFEELRDKQSLAYTVQAFSVERRAAGMFMAYIATSPDKEDLARRGLLDEFRKLRETKVTDEELHQARTYAIGTHAIRQQSGSAVLADIIDAWLNGDGLHELDEYEAKLRAVTAEGIRDLAERCWDETRRVEGVVRGKVTV